MIKLKVLVEGYAKAGENDIYLASPTSTLIYHNDLKILVDPGADTKALLTALERENLKPEDISYIFLTHYHPDHFLNLKLFRDQDFYDGTTLWQNEKEIPYEGGKIPNTEIEVIATPGHSSEHCSLILYDDNLGKVCIAQDVFWWENGKQKTDDIDEILNYPDPFANDMEDLKVSRKKVLESGAEWIIPGHGKMFRNPLLYKV